MRLLSNIVMWLWRKLFGTKVNATVPLEATSPLPPLPTGSVAAVASAITQTGRIIEQQTNLHNTEEMQEIARAKQEQTVLEETKKHIANRDVEQTRKDFAAS